MQKWLLLFMYYVSSLSQIKLNGLGFLRHPKYYLFVSDHLVISAHEVISHITSSSPPLVTLIVLILFRHCCFYLS